MLSLLRRNIADLDALFGSNVLKNNEGTRFMWPLSLILRVFKVGLGASKVAKVALRCSWCKYSKKHLNALTYYRQDHMSRLLSKKQKQIGPFSSHEAY